LALPEIRLPLWSLNDMTLLRRSLPLLLSLLVLVGAGATAFWSHPRSAQSDAAADKALEASVARGKALWRKVWKKGAKGCFACHTRGPNKMAARRLRTYPKYDKAMKRVVSARQKINNMIQSKSGGEPLDLDSDDLTALEAYIATLK
jgi:cytochrome c